jgi:hypothetical protein
VLFGDVDCSGQINSVDALKILRYAAGYVVAIGPGCPYFIGDVDCSGDIDSVDALKLLRYISGLPYTQYVPCTYIGS